MKTTTVRFGEDLWALLESEAAQTGVSVSQFIREAALARAAFLVGARAGVADELLAAWSRPLVSGDPGSPEHSAATQRLIAALARSESRRGREEATALRGESRQARRQAKTVRQERHKPATD